MITPKQYIGPLMELAQDRRGEFKEMKYITENRASVTYILPLAEVSFHICFYYKEERVILEWYLISSHNGAPAVDGWQPSKIHKMDDADNF